MCVGFPSGEGIEGCVMERGAGWVEMFLPLFGDVVFLGFGWLLGVLGGCAWTSHTPGPSREGRFGMLFSCC